MQPGGKAETAAPLPVDRVVAWLARQGVDLVGPVRAELISGGRSNLTYTLTGADGHRVVLRRPPAGGILATAHDMTREWRFISALRGTSVPVAEPLALASADSSGGGNGSGTSRAVPISRRSTPRMSASRRPYRRRSSTHVSSTAILAVLDWELATLGDPLADLGWLPRYESGVMGDDGFDPGALRAKIASQADQD